MPKPKKHPTVARVREVFDYDPTTGVMTRKVRLGNNGQAGKVVGSDGKQGYLYVSLDHGRYLLHRIAWAHYHGEWPSQVIDHIDGNGYNNAIRNLRDVAHRAKSANMLRNKSMRADAAKWRAYQDSLTVAEPVKEVSDEKIMELWNWWRGREHQIVKFARALLARYGQPAQPAASAEPMESLAALVNALRERHYGRMPDEVQQAYDRAWTIVYTAPPADWQAQQPAGDTDGGRNPFYEGRFDGESEREQKARLAAAQQDAEKVDARPEGNAPVDVLRSVWNVMQNSADGDDLLSRLDHMRDSIAHALEAQPDPAMAGDDREAFEEWHRNKFRTKHDSGQPTRDIRNGVYDDEYGPVHQQQMWEAWQEARKRVQPASVDDPGEAIDVLVAGLQSNLADAQQDNVSLLHLLALIREACGDNGKRMQDELVEYIRDERQGHISHVALLKATLKAERAEADAIRGRVKALEDGITQISEYLAPAYPSVELARSYVALLEKK